MPGPPPKHPDERVRRNKPEELIELSPPLDPVVPDLPHGEWLDSVTEWWDRAWRSPMSTMWHESDYDSLLHLAVLMQDFHSDPTPAKSAAVMRVCEQFGLTPGSRRRLRWNLAQDSSSVADIEEARDRKGKASERFKAVG